MTGPSGRSRDNPEDEYRPREVRRILVALDASPNSLAALREAADLAASLGAELIGLYVEDINLLRLADLPFARETGTFTYTSHNINRQQIEQHLRSQARQARRALQTLAENRRLRWSFSVVQGVIARELLAAAEQSDLMIVGKTGWSQGRRMGSTTRLILSQTSSPALILQRNAHLGLPVGVIYDGSRLARMGLAAALTLLRERDGYLVAIILADDLNEAQARQAEIRPAVQDASLHIHYRWLIHPSVHNLSALLKSEMAGLLVIPGRLDILQERELEDLIDETEIPVLVVR